MHPLNDIESALPAQVCAAAHRTFMQLPCKIHSFDKIAYFLLLYHYTKQKSSRNLILFPDILLWRLFNIYRNVYNCLITNVNIVNEVVFAENITLFMPFAVKKMVTPSKECAGHDIYFSRFLTNIKIILLVRNIANNWFCSIICW